MSGSKMVKKNSAVKSELYTHLLSLKDKTYFIIEYMAKDKTFKIITKSFLH